MLTSTFRNKLSRLYAHFNFFLAYYKQIAIQKTVQQNRENPLEFGLECASQPTMHACKSAYC